MVKLYGQAKEIAARDLNIRLSESRYNINTPDLKLQKNLYKRYTLTFDSPYRTGITENDRVYSDVFLNKAKQAPVLLLLHGLGTSPSRLKNYYCFIENIIKNGLSCMFLNLPFHLNRTPSGEKSGERNLYFNDIDTLKFYHQSVVDIRRLLDIADINFEFSRSMICGFSMGSMIAALALAFEKRFSKGILVLSGGNWHEIHWHSYLAYILKGNCLENEGDIITKEKCHQIYEKYPYFLSEFKKVKAPDMLDLQLPSDPVMKDKTVKMCFLCDPLTFAHMIDPGKIMMINSRFDHFFSRRSTDQLWNALGNPEIHWFNSLHSSGLLCRRKVQKIIVDFITR